MARIKVCSGLAGLALMAGLAAQEPPKAADKSAEPTRGEAVVINFTMADGADAAVTAALANHPDVRLAEAKVRVAEAELAQAKLLVAQRVAAAAARVATAKAKVGTATVQFENTKKLHQNKVVSTQEVAITENALAAAKAELAAADAELKAAQGVAPGAATVRLDRPAGTGPFDARPDATSDAILLGRLSRQATGSAADKFRTQLDKEVTLDQTKIPFDQALAALQKAAGLTDLTVRYPDWASAKVLKKPPMVGPLDGKRTVAGWLQLLVDDFNRSLPGVQVPEEYAGQVGRYDVYVRDYGLLITKADLAPTGAVTLARLTHQPASEAKASGPSHSVRVKVAELLAKTVKLPEQKDRHLRELVTGLVKAAGSDLEVASALYVDSGLTLPTGERTVAAWLALMLDLRNGTSGPSERVDVYVREYGLLLGQANSPPPGAMPLGEMMGGRQ